MKQVSSEMPKLPCIAHSGMLCTYFYVSFIVTDLILKNPE